jgi:hypothetical protein
MRGTPLEERYRCMENSKEQEKRHPVRFVYSSLRSIIQANQKSEKISLDRAIKTIQKGLTRGGATLQQVKLRRNDS